MCRTGREQSCPDLPERGRRLHLSCDGALRCAAIRAAIRAVIKILRRRAEGVDGFGEDDGDSVLCGDVHHRLLPVGQVGGPGPGVVTGVDAVEDRGDGFGDRLTARTTGDDPTEQVTVSGVPADEVGDGGAAGGRGQMRGTGHGGLQKSSGAGQHETAARLHDGDVGRKTAEKKFVC